mmetsp:Transcript_30057/g.76555  ORF Transcript_30057/g.76555 Transcript_30057/m.76555 type:complete len:336 (+) Transcript_30057:545-1552(+)
MASPPAPAPSASNRSRSTARYLSLRGDTSTTRFMRDAKGAHALMPGSCASASTARRHDRSMSSCRSTSCFTASLFRRAVSVFSSGSHSRSAPAAQPAGSAAASLATMRWQGALTSGWSPRPDCRCCRKVGVSSDARQPGASSRMSRHSNAALRSSSPSSILCLKGPRSTVRMRSSRTAVCAYRPAMRPPSTPPPATRPAFWCATALSDTTAARRTWRSSSAMPAPSSGPTTAPSAPSTACGRSTTMCFTALTTTARMLGSGALACCCTAASTGAGASSASRPRHSATTARPSSSPLPALASSSDSTCDTSASDRPLVEAGDDSVASTSASAVSSR